MLSSDQIKTNRLTRKTIRNLGPDEPLYILNTSDLDRRQTKTLVLITVTVDGERRNVAIPMTWLPIDITTQAPLSSLLSTKDFWDLIDKGYLTPISTEVAEEVLDSEDAREEMAVIHNIDVRNAQLEAEQSRITQHPVTGNKTVDQIIADQRKSMSKGVGPKDPVNPKVFSIISNTGLTENQKLSSLRNIQAELKPFDYEYILAKVSNSDTKLKEWAHRR